MLSSGSSVYDSPTPTSSPSSSAHSSTLTSPISNSNSTSTESRWEILTEWIQTAWEEWKALVSLQNNFTIRTCCVILMVSIRQRFRVELKCAFVALTGRGVVSLIQAIGGVIFSIEGFWGAVKYDPPTIKRFLIFLICYFLVSTAIAVINLETLHAYCSTAVNDDDEASCLRTAKLYSYLLLGVTLGFVPLVFGVGVVFYLSIDSPESVVRRHNASYEMADMVDRMAFRTD